MNAPTRRVHWTVEVSILNWRRMRNLLEQERFKGRIEFIEGRGLIKRPFTIRGELHNVANVAATVKSWSKEQTHDQDE